MSAVLQSVWVKVFNWDPDARVEHIVREIAYMAGYLKVVDMQSLTRNGPVGIKVAVRDPGLIKGETEVFLIGVEGSSLGCWKSLDRVRVAIKLALTPSLIGIERNIMMMKMMSTGSMKRSMKLIIRHQTRQENRARTRVNKTQIDTKRELQCLKKGKRCKKMLVSRGRNQSGSKGVGIGFH